MSSAPHYTMYIDGQWVDTENKREIHAPADNSLTATVAEGTVTHLDDAVAAAAAADKRGDWRNTSPADRAQVLELMADYLEKQVEELAVLVARENGATVRQAGAFHVGLAIASLRFSAAQAREFPFEVDNGISEAPLPAHGVVRREPIGVVGAILPFNFPLVLGNWKIGPALAAGNTIVVKPDETTPLTILELAKAAESAGLPAGVLNVVTGTGEEVGARLAAHPDVRKIAFTGSTAVGSEVMAAAAKNIKRVTLELGGKGPNVILPDANLDLAVPGSLFAFLMYNGQVCESGTRLLVPSELHDEVVSRLAEKAATIVIGDPTDPATDFGPVFSAEAKARIDSYVAKAVEDGATIAYQGAVPTDPALADGHWVAPTILTNVTNDMTIAREEIFGPVLVVISYDSVDQAIEIANDTEYGLAAGVWGGDEDQAVAVANQIQAGTVWVNDWHMFPLSGPFGGYKQSGLGRELGADAISEYTEVKYVHKALNQDPNQRAYALLFGH